MLAKGVVGGKADILLRCECRVSPVSLVFHFLASQLGFLGGQSKCEVIDIPAPPTPCFGRATEMREH